MNHHTGTISANSATRSIGINKRYRLRAHSVFAARYTCTRHIRASHTYIRTGTLHTFIYGRFRRVDRPDASHDEIALVLDDTSGYRHGRRLDLHTQLLQFNGKYTARSHIYHTRGELSVDGEIRVSAVAVCIFGRVLPLPHTGSNPYT